MADEVSRRKIPSRHKLKAARQKERLQKWKEHFKNQLGNPPEIVDKPTEKLLKTKRQQTWIVIEEELDAVLKKKKKKLKSENLHASTKYLLILKGNEIYKLNFRVMVIQFIKSFLYEK